jgi:hypothetical protein
MDGLPITNDGSFHGYVSHNQRATKRHGDEIQQWWIHNSHWDGYWELFFSKGIDHAADCREQLW